MSILNIKISQQSEIGSSDSYNVSVDGSEITLQRTIYNNLKSLVNNTTVKIEETVGSGYSQFLTDMDILHRIKYEKSTEPMPEGIEYIDEYLGELGMTRNYQMKKDIIHLKKFLNADYLNIDPTT